MDTQNDSSPVNTNKRGPKQFISNDLRSLVIDGLNRGDKAIEISKTFNIKYESVRSIYRTYKKTGCVKKKPVGHRKPILNDSQKEMICDWIDEDCTLTLEDLKTIALN
jgi:transposase